MSLSVPEVWKLIIESQLLTPEQCKQLNTAFGQVKGADHGNARTLTEWLISHNALTGYQSKVLLAGHSGPFHYGDYKVYDRVESGRFNGFFRAIHTPASHPVLLQFVTGDAAADGPQWNAAAVRAVRLSAVKHALFQRIYEPVDLGGFKFAAIEDLHGEAVAAKIKTSPLPPGEACFAIKQAATALAAIHDAGLVHGDIRPDNLFALSTGHYRLQCDPFANPTGINGNAADVAARADYLAPELAQQGASPSQLTDIYALGCTFYELLTGQPPFPGGDTMQKLGRHASEAIQPLEPQGVPQPVAQVVAYMMAKNHQVRYKTGAEVVQHLTPHVDPQKARLPAAPQVATMAAYESSIKQKQAELSGRGAAPSVAVGAPSIQTAAPPKTAKKPGIQLGETGTSTVASRKRPSKGGMLSKQNLIIGGSLLGGMLLILVGVIAVASMGSPDYPAADGVAADGAPVDGAPAADANASADDAAPAADTVPVAGNGAPEAGANAQVIKPDNGKMLWASPTTGKPISLAYAPPGGQVFMNIRPAALLAAPQGGNVLQALGPNFAEARAAWEKAAGIRLEDIDRMLISIHDNNGKMPRPAFVVKLKQPAGMDELLKRWGNPAAKLHEGEQYYNVSNWTFYPPPAESGGLFVMGSPEDVKEVIDFKGREPGARREVRELLQTSDADRHVSIVMAPEYLFNSGHLLLAGELKRLRDPLQWFLGPDLLAASMTMHFEPHLYAEFRQIVAGRNDYAQLGTELKNRVNESSNQVERYFVQELKPAPYWSLLGGRYPQMVREIQRNVRTGIDDSQMVANVVLPAVAAPNLLAGGELAIAQAPGAAPQTAVAVKKTTPTDINSLLQYKTSMKFNQKSLEFAMGDIASDVKEELPELKFPFEIKIVGEDLKKDGLTRNQQIRNVDIRDKPLHEILTTVVVTAMATGKPPSDVSQKMVWVIGPDPAAPDQKIILVTTRAAVAEKGYTLPEDFK